MKIKEILNVTRGKMLFGNEELEVENFSKDTRTIQKGDIYIGIKGEKFDGSNFWNQALDAGATAVIVSNIQISKEEKEKNQIKDVKIVANLPYYITTPIIMKLLEENLDIASITVMIQKEVADRLIETPSGKNTGAITYTVYYYCECKKIREVENTCFIPMPEVTSEVINLKLRKEPAVDVENKKVFFNIIKSAFMQRRKTLLNALVNTGVFKSKEEGMKVLKKLNLREDIRAEKLTIEDFARICNYFCESIK